MKIHERAEGSSASQIRVDLHLHSTASDGSLAADALVAAAAGGGLDIIALADHDTTAGVPAAAAASADAGLTLVTAIELSASYGDAEVHILGYGVDPEHASLRAHGESAVTRRRERVVEMLQRLAALNVAVEMDDVLEAAGQGHGSLGRPHVARAVVARGYAGSVAEAFDRWLADDGPAFVPTALLEPRDAVALIHESGGLALWAHPAPRQFEPRLEHFAASGLDGIECYRPRLNAVDQGRLERAAASYGLLLSGGSDWHGGWQGRLGDFFVPADRVAPLLERLGL